MSSQVRTVRPNDDVPDNDMLEERIYTLQTDAIEVPLRIHRYVHLYRERLENNKLPEPLLPPDSLAIDLGNACRTSLDRARRLEKVLHDLCSERVRQTYDTILGDWLKHLTFADTFYLRQFVSEQIEALYEHKMPLHMFDEIQRKNPRIMSFPRQPLDELVTKGVDYTMLFDLRAHWTFRNDTDFYLARKYDGSGQQQMATQCPEWGDESDYDSSDGERPSKVQRNVS